MPTTLSSLRINSEKTAKTARLIYVNDHQPGIYRLKKGRRFVYMAGKKQLKDPQLLNRIKKLVIPPAWKDVWICKLDNGHLQATGVDQKNRKQYKYHASWSEVRNQAKFTRLHEFGKCLPKIRQRIKSDLELPGLPKEKVLAAMISLMEYTGIRVGNSVYEKLYDSIGLTTLKDKHVKFKGSEIDFEFKGKWGIMHHLHVHSKKLAAIVKECRDVPGKVLFQYYDDKGEHHTMTSAALNSYIKEISGKDFTTKDFRTWEGTLHAFQALKNTEVGKTAAAIKRGVVSAIDQVAAYLGNTRTICRKYYVHPTLISLFEQNRLFRYAVKKERPSGGLSSEEKILLTILRRESFLSQ